MTRAEIYREIEEMLGLVPGFFKLQPDSSLEAEWQMYKRMEFDEGAVPGKYRQLIGLAVSAATRCHYCTFYHTEVSKGWGAKDAEIEAAVHVAKSAMGWGTYFEGLQFQFDPRKADALKACARDWKKAIEAQKKMSDQELHKQLNQQFEQMLGPMPPAMRASSDAAVRAEWQLFTQTWFEEGAIPQKYRHLMGLAVAAVTRSRSGAHLHTTLAKAFGASDAEIEDAVHYAKFTAGWSAYGNGMQLDYEQFKDEVARACRHIREAKKVAAA